MSEQDDDDRLRGMARHVVRFTGELSPEAAAALGPSIQRIQGDHLFPTRTPQPNTTVGTWAATDRDAVRLVQGALQGHGSFADFEVTRLVD